MECVLCKRSDESAITGPLSPTRGVAAHQNCLLYASGLYCENSPEFDDLFGFSAKAVREEVKRARLLTCAKCTSKGATAGCEVKRCQKSYHYPCAVEDGAKTVNDLRKGTYGLYCPQHCSKITGSDSPLNGCTPVTYTKTCCQGGPSKKRPTHSVHRSEPSAKCTPKKKRILQLFSSDSESENDEAPLGLIAPIEIDSDEEFQDQETRMATESVGGSAGSHRGAASGDESGPDLQPLPPDVGTDVGTPTKATVSKGSALVKGEVSPEQSLAQSPGPVAAAVPSPPPDPMEVPGDGSSPRPSVQAPADAWAPSSEVLEPGINSASFWKRCNEAGLTGAIFSSFIKETRAVAQRILSDQASQEDYDLALSVMEASGNLVNLVTKQTQEMERKQMELHKAAASMKMVLAALKR